MKKIDLRGVAWLACLALLVQGLAACSATDSPTAPTTDDGVTIQRVDVIDDGTGGGESPPNSDDDGQSPGYTGGGQSPIKSPVTPDEG